MSDSDDNDLLFATSDQEKHSIQMKGLMGNSKQNGGKTSENRRLKKTLALCGAFFGLGLAVAVLGPTLQDLQVQLHADLPHVSYIFTGRSAGYVLGSILGGIVFERFHPLMLIAGTLALSGIGLLVTPYCQQLIVTVVCISFVGAAMGALDTGANVVCLRMWGKKSSPFMQALHFSFALGAFIAPLLAGPFIVNPVHTLGGSPKSVLSLDTDGDSLGPISSPDTFETKGSLLQKRRALDTLEFHDKFTNQEIEILLTRSKRRALSVGDVVLQGKDKNEELGGVNLRSRHVLSNKKKHFEKKVVDKARFHAAEDVPFKRVKKSHFRSRIMLSIDEGGEGMAGTNDNSFGGLLDTVEPAGDVDDEEEELTSTNDYSFWELFGAEVTTGSPGDVDEEGGMISTTSDSFGGLTDVEGFVTTFATPIPTTDYIWDKTKEDLFETTEDLVTTDITTALTGSLYETGEDTLPNNTTSTLKDYTTTEEEDKMTTAPKDVMDNTAAEEDHLLNKILSSPEDVLDYNTTEEEGKMTAAPKDVMDNTTATGEESTIEFVYYYTTEIIEYEDDINGTAEPWSSGNNNDEGIDATADPWPSDYDNNDKGIDATAGPWLSDYDNNDEDVDATTEPWSNYDGGDDTYSTAWQWPSDSDDNEEDVDATTDPMSDHEEDTDSTSWTWQSDSVYEDGIDATGTPWPSDSNYGSLNWDSLQDSSWDFPSSWIESSETTPDGAMNYVTTGGTVTDSAVDDITSDETGSDSATEESNEQMSSVGVPDDGDETSDADNSDRNDKTDTTNSEDNRTRKSNFQGVYIIIATFLMLMALVFSYFFCTSPLELHPAGQFKDSHGEVRTKSADNNFTGYILILLFIFYFLYVGAEVGYGGFIYTFATDHPALQFTKSKATHLNALFWGTFAFGRGVSICIASLVSPLMMIVIDLVGCFGSSMALAIAADTSSSILWFATAILGLSMASLFPAGISWLESHAPVTGNMASFLVVGSALGEMVIPLLLGNLFTHESVGPMSLMYIMCFISVLTVAIFGTALYLAGKEGRNYDPLPKEDTLEDILTGVQSAIDPDDLPNRPRQTGKSILPKVLRAKKHKI